MRANLGWKLNRMSILIYLNLNLSVANLDAFIFDYRLQEETK
mgnify:CR=1 FL=1